MEALAVVLAIGFALLWSELRAINRQLQTINSATGSVANRMSGPIAR